MYVVYVALSGNENSYQNSLNHRQEGYQMRRKEYLLPSLLPF